MRGAEAIMTDHQWDGLIQMFIMLLESGQSPEEIIQRLKCLIKHPEQERD